MWFVAMNVVLMGDRSVTVQFVMTCALFCDECSDLWANNYFIVTNRVSTKLYLSLAFTSHNILQGWLTLLRRIAHCLALLS